MIGNTLPIESFENLPARGNVEFRVPTIDGDLQIEREYTIKDPEPVFAQVNFDIRTRLSYKQVVLSRPEDGAAIQIYHGPTQPQDFPGGIDDLSFLRNTTIEELAMWKSLMHTAQSQNEDHSPVYLRALRYCLRQPVAQLVLRQSQPEEPWEISGGGVLFNAYGTQKFLELAGKAALRKLTPPEQIAA